MGISSASELSLLSDGPKWSLGISGMTKVGSSSSSEKPSISDTSSFRCVSTKSARSGEAGKDSEIKKHKKSNTP